MKHTPESKKKISEGMKRHYRTATALNNQPDVLIAPKLRQENEEMRATINLLKNDLRIISADLAATKKDFLDKVRESAKFIESAKALAWDSLIDSLRKGI